MPATTPALSQRLRRSVHRLARIGVALLILSTLMDRIFYKVIAVADPDSIYTFDRVVVVFVSDAILAAVGIIGFVLLFALPIRLVAKGAAGALGLAGLAVFATIALAFHVDAASVVFWFRTVFGVGVVAAVATFDRRQFHQFVVYPLLAVLAIESLVALAQVFVFDSGVERTRFLPDAAASAWTIAQGTAFGPYQLAFVLVVGVAIVLGSQLAVRGQRIAWSIAGAATFTIAFTAGRTGAIAVLLVVAVYGIGAFARRSRRLTALASITAIPFLAGVLLNLDIWLARADKTFQSDSLDGASSGRIEMARNAVEMMMARPLRGYGLRQWVAGLEDLQIESSTTTPVHNIPLLAGAQMGIAAFVLMLTWYVVLGYRALRTSVAATAIFVSAMPVLMLDKMTFDDASMMIVGFIWLAALDHHWIHRNEERYEVGSSSVSSA